MGDTSSGDGPSRGVAGPSEQKLREGGRFPSRQMQQETACGVSVKKVECIQCHLGDAAT